MLGPRPIAVLAGAVLVSVALVPTASGDTREQREEVRRQEASVASDLDVLAAQDAEIAAALDLLTANLAAEQEALNAAQAQVAATEARLAEARAVEAETEEEIVDVEGDVEALAIQAYVGSSTATPLGFAIDSDDPLELSHRATLADSATAELNDALDRLELLRQQLEAARGEAEAAAAQAAALRAEVEARVVALQTASDQHAALAAEVAARIESRLGEAAALAALDSQLSAEITAQEVELGRRVAAFATGGGDVNLGAPPPLRSVRGITVHADIADAVDALVAAAADDGIVLGGGGYRDPAQQWALRVAHCPDPANSPPSDCAPPTARVGTSNHEQGLAIDFIYEGRAISSHDNPGYLWLEANAGRFGFHNLPSEPWHWSVDGS